MDGLPQNKKVSALHHTVIPGLVGVILLLVVGFYYNLDDRVRQFVSDISGGGVPTGTIYLSLTTPPHGESPMNIYTFDVEQKTLSTLTDDDYFEYATSKISPDGTRIAYAVGEYNVPGLRMFVSAIDDMENGTEVLPEIGSQIQRNPVWSPDGAKLAFMVRDDHGGATSEIKGWYVYVYDFRSGEGRFVSEGINPLFTPEGQLLVLQTDGLYMFDVRDTDVVGSRIWEVEGGDALQTMKLAISPNGTMIAWTAAGHKNISLIEVYSWAPFVGTHKTTISADGYWPVFSPDNAFLAYQEVDIEGDVITNPRLMVYDIARGTTEKLYDLGAFVQEAMFVTDWR